jgi:hypothetical protein
MAYTSGDSLQPTKRNRKYRGMIKITNEMMAQGILGLPKGVEIIDVYSDHRDVVHFRLMSSEPHKETLETGEGMEYAQSADVMRLLQKKAISGAINIKKYYPELYEELVKEIEAEEAEQDA